MTITAKVLADSISPEGIRLTTFELRYPRFIHAEELTHRILETQPELVIYEAVPDGLMYDQDLSRNASSNRAIPVQRMIEDLRRDPAMPEFWGSNKPGMQAGEELTEGDLYYVQQVWLAARDNAIASANVMIKSGLHKQIANRILEPWAHINVVVTATEWANFFALRAHPDAQPEIRILAEAMMAAMGQSDPQLLNVGVWHLPYVSEEDHFNHDIEILKKVSVARCARVSYLTHDGRPTSVEEDLSLYEKLLVSQPLHASPAEHQATPDSIYKAHRGNKWNKPKLHGNLKGWCQFRKMLPNEFIAG